MLLIYRPRFAERIKIGVVIRCDRKGHDIAGKYVDYLTIDKCIVHGKYGGNLVTLPSALRAVEGKWYSLNRKRPPSHLVAVRQTSLVFIAECDVAENDMGESIFSE